MDACPCGSPLSFSECCGPLIKGERAARTAEELMRSRYSAYVKKELDYIFTSLHPEHRSDYDAKSTQAWAESAQWHGFELMDAKGGKEDDAEGQVEFVATFTDKGIRQQYHELSSFKKEGGAWYFTTGKHLPPPQAVRTGPKTGRNDPCPCGSGKKFKKCCG